MRSVYRGVIITLAALGVLGWTQPPPVETVIYSFKGGSDGSNPNGGLISDKEGALYGTTSNGGGSGTVFKLTPPTKGQTTWTKTVLYSFCSLQNCSDGRLPAELASGLVFDKKGALHGTAGGGGTGDQGLVFELAPPAKGQTAWTETVLYSFKGGSDGSVPVGPIADIGGVLYGTTGGGGLGSGTVFKLTPPTKGETTWTKTGLYSFCSLPSCSDGSSPNGGLIADKEGALYGTTSGGGNGVTIENGGYGLVFKLTPPAKGQTAWTETVLYSFCAKPICSNINPRAGLIADKEGALYGTTSIGGAGNNGGTVFKLRPPGKGWNAWKETVLYSFCSLPDCSDGSHPYLGEELIAVEGALYGTTNQGGSYSSGTVFTLTLCPDDDHDKCPDFHSEE